jgi:long-chain acyl-CoA synthetase
VQFKSPGMFTGYWQEPEKTAEALTEDGFVKTGDAGFFEPDGQLKIVDRAKDVGRLANGQMFAPKYIENKLKFYADIREAVALGDGRDFVAVMLNIELASVGNWAERNGVSYASYQELAGHSQVGELIRKHVEAVNRALAEEPAMAGAQIRRFLILPKELDADDGELTRTQKVRRRFIAERYAPLVEGLYSGAREAAISAEIVFEDGRKGRLEGRSAIHDMAPAEIEPAPARVAA